MQNAITNVLNSAILQMLTYLLKQMNGSALLDSLNAGDSVAWNQVLSETHAHDIWANAK